MVATEPQSAAGARAGAVPQDVAAERAVIGAILAEAGVLERVAPILVPPDFIDPRHRLLFVASLDLWDRGEAVDPVTVAAELARRGWIDEVGGQPLHHQPRHRAAHDRRRRTLRPRRAARRHLSRHAPRGRRDRRTRLPRRPQRRQRRSPRRWRSCTQYAAQSSARTSPSCRTCSATCCRTRSMSMAASSRPCAPGSATSIGCSTAACTPPTSWCSPPGPPSASLLWRSPSPANVALGQSATVAMFSLEMSAEQVAGQTRLGRVRR